MQGTGSHWSEGLGLFLGTSLSLTKTTEYFTQEGASARFQRIDGFVHLSPLGVDGPWYITVVNAHGMFDLSYGFHRPAAPGVEKQRFALKSLKAQEDSRGLVWKQGYVSSHAGAL